MKTGSGRIPVTAPAAAPDDPHYVGDELRVFAAARVWRRYVRSLVRPHLGHRVLEVGAGLGTRTEDLAPLAPVERWTALEPDPTFARRLKGLQAEGVLPPTVEVCEGELAADLEPQDCILYLDVLEHIADDRAEIMRAAARLAPGGRLVVLAPAHQSLFSVFDRAVGHHRRYDRESLRALTLPELELRTIRYVDAAGLIASAANRYLLRSAHPNATQVATWDRCLVPLSRILDPLTFGRLGKSIFAVWTRRSSGEIR